MGNYMSSSVPLSSQRGQGIRRRQNSDNHAQTHAASHDQSRQHSLSSSRLHANDVYVSHLPPLTETLSTELAQAQASPVSSPGPTLAPSENDAAPDYMPLWSLNPRASLQRRQRLFTDEIPNERPTRRRRLNPSFAEPSTVIAPATAASPLVPQTEPTLATPSAEGPARQPNMSLFIFRRHPLNEPPSSNESPVTHLSTAGLFQTLMQSWSRLANSAATITPSGQSQAGATEPPIALSNPSHSPSPSSSSSSSSETPTAEPMAPNPALQMQYTFVIVGNPSQSQALQESMAAADSPDDRGLPRHHIQTDTVEEGLHSLIQWIALMLNADPANIRLENRDTPISFEDLLALEDWMGRVSRGVPQSLVDEQLKPLLYVASESDTLRNCPVCLENFQVNDKIRSLPCAHHYHTQCIDPWLTGHRNNCPLCRAVPITVASP